MNTKKRAGKFGDFKFMGIGGIALFFACLGFVCALLTKRKEGEKTVLKYWKELMLAFGRTDRALSGNILQGNVYA